jgi:outer membrane protein OmpA-like peptidoglycan-associated protein
MRLLGTAALGVWLFACAAASSPAASAGADATAVQALPPAAEATVADYIGLCQCLDDKTGVHLRCMPGVQRCQSACASTHYAFLPLIDAALRQCAPHEVYVVLPNADGRPGSGAIVVEGGSRSMLLDRPYSAAAAMRGEKPAGVVMAEADVHTIFARALAARPMLPRRFILFFPLGGVEPLPQSMLDYRNIIADAKRRPVYEVQVIGYTDTLADPGYNVKLGLERAERIRSDLIRDGINAGAVSVASRGEMDLLVPTGNQVAEPRNRRVEVTVR